MIAGSYELKKLRAILRSGAGGNMLKREPRRPMWHTMALGARDLRQRGGLNGSSSLENFTKRIDFRTNFLAAVTLSTSMKYLKVENNHRGVFRICTRTPPKG